MADIDKFIPSLSLTNLQTVDFPAPLGPETTYKAPKDKRCCVEVLCL